MGVMQREREMRQSKKRTGHSKGKGQFRHSKKRRTRRHRRGGEGEGRRIKMMPNAFQALVPGAQFIRYIPKCEPSEKLCVDICTVENVTNGTLEYTVHRKDDIERECTLSTNNFKIIGTDNGGTSFQIIPVTKLESNPGQEQRPNPGYQRAQFAQQMPQKQQQQQQLRQQQPQQHPQQQPQQQQEQQQQEQQQQQAENPTVSKYNPFSRKAQTYCCQKTEKPGAGYFETGGSSCKKSTTGLCATGSILGVGQAIGVSTKRASAKLRCFSNNPNIPFPDLDPDWYIHHGEVIDISKKDGAVVKPGKMKCEFVSGMAKFIPGFGLHA